MYLLAVDHVFAQDNGWKRMRLLVKELAAAFALAVPRTETDEIVSHLTFFQRVTDHSMMNSFQFIRHRWFH